MLVHGVEMEGLCYSITFVCAHLSPLRPHKDRLHPLPIPYKEGGCIPPLCILQTASELLLSVPLGEVQYPDKMSTLVSLMFVAVVTTGEDLLYKCPMY